MSDKTIFIQKGTKGKVQKIELQSTSTIKNVLEKGRTVFKFEDDIILVAEQNGESLDQKTTLEHFHEKSIFVIKTKYKSFILENQSGRKITISMTDEINDAYDLAEEAKRQFGIEDKEDSNVFLRNEDGSIFAVGHPLTEIPENTVMKLIESEDQLDEKNSVTHANEDEDKGADSSST